MRGLWTSEDLSKATGVQMASGIVAGGVSIDTRSLNEGDLFIALRGENMDGHEFARQAEEKKAAAILADHPIPGVSLPQIVVSDTFQALRNLASFAVSRSLAKRIAVTGSVGKTGTKEMLALALSAQAPVHATQGNLNNHYGLPLTLARMPQDAAYAVLEMGMNHAGEITPLSELAKPQVAVVTTVEPVHIEFFPTLSAIAEAKAEIFKGMSAGGIAVLNRDNPFFGLLARRAREHGARVISFGGHIESEFRLLHSEIVGASTEVLALAGEKPLAYRIGVPGHHWAVNSLAVLAALHAVGADTAKGAQSLQAMTPPKGRGARREIEIAQGKTFELIDESYNASPASMKAAIVTLAQIRLQGKGRRIAVLGDMLELGTQGPALHRGLKTVLEEAGIDRVYTAGPLMEGLFEELPQPMRAGHAANSAELAPLVAAHVQAGDIVMVKGSAGSRMGRVVEALERPKGVQAQAANGH
ncbi:UDP-N-acetylmuramoyl-tripeptide--D-alanyl-D-alanine ligase (fragment) [Rhodospirillaceae bacterium LM-1]